jgi:diguanylate cyclase (GGDEF)-like protein
MVVVGAWFSVGNLIGVPETPDPHRWVMFACVLQGIGWAVALGDRALSLQRERDRAWALAELDELTGLPNRRMLDRELAELRSGWLLICDLDTFKSVNDRYGHAVGDRCLVHFAQCMREALAGAAVFGRYGGEEFLAIVPGGEREQARSLAERLRERTASTPVHVDVGDHRLTVSIGIAALDTLDPKAALGIADQAMYRAKAAGRNRVEMAY